MYLPCKQVPLDPARPRPFLRDWLALQFWALAVQTDDNGNVNVLFQNQGTPNAGFGGVQNASAHENAQMLRLMQKLKLKIKRIRRQQMREKVLANAAVPMFTGFTYNDLRAIAAVCRYPQTGVHPRPGT
jgi:hypothetical protein